MNHEEAKRSLDEKKKFVELEMSEEFPNKKFEIDIFSMMGGYSIELGCGDVNYAVWSFTGYTEAYGFLEGMLQMFKFLSGFDFIKNSI
jgi:hypothetical protein